MSMDLQRFHVTFFEESREGLDAMEAGLLSLEQAAAIRRSSTRSSAQRIRSRAAPALSGSRPWPA